MSLKRTLATAVAVTATAAVPLLSPAPAMAASSDPYLDYFNTAVDMSNLVELVAAAPLCIITMESTIAKARFGAPSVKRIYPVLEVDFSPTNTYVATVSGAVGAFITCTLT